jgi:intraflagellar transport protein 80
MHVDLFNWERALELAVQHKTHVDTVLYFRAKYLKNLGRFEGNKKFIQYSEQVPVEWEKIDAKIQYSSFDVRHEMDNEHSVRPVH